MKHKIITISREFGSAGRDVGKLIASSLNIPFYDRAIVDLAAKESGMSAEFIENGEQKITTSMLFNVAAMGFGGYVSEAGNSLADKIFMEESKVIRDLAAKGPCVIVGRCADFILKDKADCFNVFMYAAPEFRIKRVMDEKGISEKEAEKLVRITDKRRARHYEYYTGKDWGKAQNYNLCVDAKALGIEKAAKVIVEAAGIL